jgi:hypothetical protein
MAYERDVDWSKRLFALISPGAVHSTIPLAAVLGLVYFDFPQLALSQSHNWNVVRGQAV